MKKNENKFENKMQELEQIVAKLEKGELSLEESVKAFEDGMKLSKECNDILENTEKRITILLNDGEKMKEEDFINN